MKTISDEKELDGVCLDNIDGTNLWKASINIPCDKRQVEFGISFKFDSSVQFNVWKIGPVRLYEKNKEFRTAITRFSADSLLIIQLALDEYKEEEYYCHFLYILRSAKDGEELKCITQTQMLEKMSLGLNQKQKEEIIKKIIQTVQKNIQIQRANSAAILCFLSQMNIPTLQLQNILPMNFSKEVFLQCLSVICITKSIQGVYKAMEEVYKSGFRVEANFMSYCNYMYQFFGPKISCEMLSKWKNGNKITTLLPKDFNYASQF